MNRREIKILSKFFDNYTYQELKDVMDDSISCLIQLAVYSEDRIKINIAKEFYKTLRHLVEKKGGRDE